MTKVVGQKVCLQLIKSPTKTRIFQYLKNQGGHFFVGYIWTSWPWYKSTHTSFSSTRTRAGTLCDCVPTLVYSS